MATAATHVAKESFATAATHVAKESLATAATPVIERISCSSRSSDGGEYKNIIVIPT